MPIRFRLAEHVTMTTIDGFGAVLTDLRHNRIFALNRTAAALVASVIDDPAKAVLPPMPELIQQAPTTATRWSDNIIADLLDRDLLREMLV